MRLPIALSCAVLLFSSCVPEEDPPVPPCAEDDGAPGPFQVGVAEVRMPVPLGIGTAGFNGLFGAPNSDSPFADRYPATAHIHGHPDFKIIAMSRGPGHEVVLVRSDMVAVIQQLRDAAAATSKTGSSSARPTRTPARAASSRAASST